MMVYDMQFFFACTNIKMVVLEVSKILSSKPQKYKLKILLDTLTYLKNIGVWQMYSLLTDQKYLSSVLKSHNSNAKRKFGNLDNLVGFKNS